MKELEIGGLGMHGCGCKGGSTALFGLVGMEVARIDPIVLDLLWRSHRPRSGGSKLAVVQLRLSGRAMSPDNQVKGCGSEP